MFLLAQEVAQNLLEDTRQFPGHNVVSSKHLTKPVENNTINETLVKGKKKIHSGITRVCSSRLAVGGTISELIQTAEKETQQNSFFLTNIIPHFFLNV